MGLKTLRILKGIFARGIGCFAVGRFFVGVFMHIALFRCAVLFGVSAPFFGRFPGGLYFKVFDFSDVTGILNPLYIRKANQKIRL